MTDSSTWGWLTSIDNWKNSYSQTGISTQIGNHVEYSLIAVVIAAAIALPLGLLIGHTGRLRWLVGVANGLRALPTIGLLILFYVLLAPHFHGRGNAVFLIPTEIVLILLAVPPILANTFAGVQNVDPAARDAASGMGMTGTQVLFRVELPNALPLIFSGVRSATLQVIATATVAAYVGLGGLGRFVYDGLASHDFPQVTGGAILVAVLALLADIVLSLLQRYAVSRGVSGRFSSRAGTGGPAAAEITQLEVVTH
ncbi:MAG: ABC transporter permease [Jatrophihabitantaceae bacterium]